MSVTIRLSKEGRKNAPTYKVVVSNTKDKRTGKFLDVLGYFNPQKNPKELIISQEKVIKWKQNGALITKAVSDLLAGTYEYTKYDPKAKKGQ